MIHKGSDIVVKSLQRKNVKVIYHLPGGSIIPLYNSLKNSDIKQVLCRNEQCIPFMASSYAKVSNTVGVGLVTSGPGCSNAITGVYDASMDSMPIVMISGNVPTRMQGLDSFQESPITDMVSGFCKEVFKVQDINHISRVIEEAFFVAEHGRKGPVWIDVPKDILNGSSHYNEKPYINIAKYDRNIYKTLTNKTMEKVVHMLMECKKPLLYIGGGCLDVSQKLYNLLHFLKIPVVSTIMGLGVINKNYPHYLGMLGMHGTIEANYAVSTCDVLIALGVRFDDRVTGKLEEFASHAKIIHVDIDSKEIGKNKEVDVGVCNDVSKFLDMLLPYFSDTYIRNSYQNWYNDIISNTTEKRNIFLSSKASGLTADYAVSVLNNICSIKKIKPIVTTGVGQHQMVTCTTFDFYEPRRFVSSSGAGTMGTSLSYAIGAWFANPSRTIISIDGDGSFLMNIQELATMKTNNVPVKIVIINNQKLGMVTQWGNRFHSYSDYTFLGDPHDSRSPYPDFVSIAKGFGIPCMRVDDAKDLIKAYETMLSSEGSYLLDVLVEDTECLPFIPSNSSYKDIIVA